MPFCYDMDNVTIQHNMGSSFVCIQTKVIVKLNHKGTLFTQYFAKNYVKFTNNNKKNYCRYCVAKETK